MRTPVDVRFERGDPVREYWLARGEGFEVETYRGRVIGRVVDTVLDPGEGRIVSLVVRWTLLGTVRRRMSEVPVEDIRAAVPARAPFVLDSAGQRPESAGERQTHALVLTRMKRALAHVYRALAVAGRGARTGGSRPWRDLVARAASLGRAAAITAAAWLAGAARQATVAVSRLLRRARAELGPRQASRLPE